MIDLIPIQEVSAGVSILYSLLGERTPDQSISHKSMPSFEEHTKFVESNPYLAWYIIHDKAEGELLGTIYLTYQREIGISIFKHSQGRGVGKKAVSLLMEKHPGVFYANINPKNHASIRFFESLGAKHIQNTYLL